MSALNGLVAEYSRGSVTGTLKKTFTGFVYVDLAEDPDNCAAVIAVVNGMLGSFKDGTFAGCEMTTPTSCPAAWPTATLSIRNAGNGVCP